MGKAVQVGLILFLYLVQIQAVKSSVVKEVSLAPPDLVIHLAPLNSGVNPDLDLACFEITFAGFGRSHCRSDDPVLALAIEHFFAIERNAKTAQAVHYLVEFAFLQIKLVERETRWRTGGQGTGRREL